MTLVGIISQIETVDDSPRSGWRRTMPTRARSDDSPARNGQGPHITTGKRAAPQNIRNPRKRLHARGLLSCKRCARHSERQLLDVVTQGLNVLVAQMPLDPYEIPRLLVHLGR